MRTLIIIVGGIIAYGVFLLVARTFMPTSAATILLAKVFIPLWFVAAACNMWIGVTRAGYSVAEELPIFLLIFVIPAAVAALAWWKVG